MCGHITRPPVHSHWVPQRVRPRQRSAPSSLILVRSEPAHLRTGSRRPQGPGAGQALVSGDRRCQPTRSRRRAARAEGASAAREPGFVLESEATITTPPALTSAATKTMKPVLASITLSLAHVPKKCLTIACSQPRPQSGISMPGSMLVQELTPTKYRQRPSRLVSSRGIFSSCRHHSLVSGTAMPYAMSSLQIFMDSSSCPREE